MNTKRVSEKSMKDVQVQHPTPTPPFLYDSA